MKRYQLKEARRAYVAYVKGRGFSAGTVRRIESLFRPPNPWTDSKDVREIGDADIASFRKGLDEHIVKRSGKPLKLSSKHAMLNTLRGFFHFLERDGFILVDPVKDMRLQQPLFLPKALSVAKVEALIAFHNLPTPLGQRNRAMFEVLYGTGLRLSECARLDLSDIDLREGTLLVRNGKGRKDRYVPITGRARDAVQTYLVESRPLFAERRDSGALFLAARGHRLSDQSIRVMVRGTGKQIGIRISPHVLRHSFATHLLEGGASIVHVQKLLGHQSIGTTGIYTKVGTAAVRGMIEKRHPRERSKGRPPSA
ncbi:MAG: tyrosine-type recombinase/integrase [Vicinamibacteria bacterium]|nr:tyrosine-type recombinase/integrase [Vicinamibacteria bacterium]MBP9944826.1 tyrosine-type recombinase/integrase [Vicinamibacteria bacterium]